MTTEEILGSITHLNGEAMDKLSDAHRHVVKLYDTTVEQARYIHDIEQRAKQMAAQIEKLQAFKNYVHDRLDIINIPKFDDGRECRIGARIDYITEKMQRDTIPGVGEISISRGNDGFWLDIRHGSKHASIHIDGPKGSICDEALEAVAIDLR